MAGMTIKQRANLNDDQIDLEQTISSKKFWRELIIKAGVDVGSGQLTLANAYFNGHNVRQQDLDTFGVRAASADYDILKKYLVSYIIDDPTCPTDYSTLIGADISAITAQVNLVRKYVWNACKAIEIGKI